MMHVEAYATACVQQGGVELELALARQCLTEDYLETGPFEWLIPLQELRRLPSPRLGSCSST